MDWPFNRYIVALLVVIFFDLKSTLSSIKLGTYVFLLSVSSLCIYFPALSLQSASKAISELSF